MLRYVIVRASVWN